MKKSKNWRVFTIFQRRSTCIFARIDVGHSGPLRGAVDMAVDVSETGNFTQYFLGLGAPN